MLRGIHNRPRFADVLSLLALFVALGGTSYAVATGSIDSREIKNNSVRGTDVRNQTLTGRDARDRSLLADDFARGQLPAGPRGSTGPAGPPGRAGAPGEPGQPGATNVVARRGPALPVASGESEVHNAQCNPGERATGGGAAFFGGTAAANELFVDRSHPATNGIATANGAIANGWQAAGRVSGNAPTDESNLTVWVICAAP